MLTLLLSSLTISFAAAEPVQLDYVQKVDGGWVLTDENIIALANYIQELQDENTRLKAQVEALQKALDEERMLTDSLLAEKDRIIELQTKQIEEVKFVYENSKPSVFDKAYLVLGGAGIAATILLLARALQ
jgi:flagellar motility protein MotE (MotC chaperone)